MCIFRLSFILVVVFLLVAVFGQTRDPRCRMPINSGECRNITRYRYDQNTRRCVSFAYRGEGGNTNNFNTQRACQARCEIDRPFAIGFQLG